MRRHPQAKFLISLTAVGGIDVIEIPAIAHIGYDTWNVALRVQSVGHDTFYCKDCTPDELG